MIAVKSKDIKQNFESMCNMVFGGETLVISRPKNENVVLISEQRYEELEKAQKNAEYLAKIDKGFEQIRAGKGQIHELIEED